MQGTYEINEKLVWLHVDDKTGEKLNEIVTVMKKRDYPNSCYYTCRVESTGEVTFAWHDELKRFKVR